MKYKVARLDPAQEWFLRELKSRRAEKAALVLIAFFTLVLNIATKP